MAERRHPEWIKVRAPVSPEYFRTRALLAELRLHSVCQEAACPNIGECFSHRTATFMLMGDVCTRNCPYCASRMARPARSIRTSRGVSPRPPRGSGSAYRGDFGRSRRPAGRRRRAFRRDRRAIKRTAAGGPGRSPGARFQGRRSRASRLWSLADRDLTTIISRPCRASTGSRVPAAVTNNRSRCCATPARSARAAREVMQTKAGIMLGLGERDEEVTRRDTRSALRRMRHPHARAVSAPSPDHLPVARYVPPAEFAELRIEAMKLGFRHVESGPLVRSSYHAWEHVH